MIGRVIEVATERCYLSVKRGFMVVRREDEEVGRTPLDDIAVVLCTGYGVSYSNNLLVSLASRNAFLVVCASNFMPVAWLWPVEGHHAQVGNMNRQLAASLPLKKRVWQSLVRTKIRQQAAVLNQVGRTSARLEQLAKEVKSGDSTNVEAQAARVYWPALFGEDFRRDQNAGGINALLNYGYTIVRSAVARAVVSAGLHPSIAVHHSHRGDTFALADDLVEVFRPHVDLAIVRLVNAGHEEVNPTTKQVLAGILSHDLATCHGTTPLQSCCDRLAASLARSFNDRKCALDLPYEPHPLELADDLCRPG